MDLENKKIDKTIFSVILLPFYYLLLHFPNNIDVKNVVTNMNVITKTIIECNKMVIRYNEYL